MFVKKEEEKRINSVKTEEICRESGEEREIVERDSERRNDM